MKEEVGRIIKEILLENGIEQKNEIENGDDLRELGLKSFDLAVLTVKIEDLYDIDIFEEGLITKVGEIVELLEKSGK
tara:strand:+ start:474 stop:704 length:231 start_codon:yes stop_codon:yes gene_type:complete